MKRNRRNKAFTLVEILIVVVILGILAAIVVPQFTSATQDAQTGNIRAQLKEVQNQIELFHARTGSYPTLAQLQAATVTNVPAYTSWGVLIDGKYLKSPPKNPVNGSSLVDAVPTANHGWHYDVATGALGADYYDETNDVLTPGTP